MEKNGQKYYYHVDGLSSVTALTDSTGNVVQRYNYDGFGNITNMQDPNFIQPYTYTSREYDPESGLYYYRARYYDAKIGRFISEDPIGILGEINKYVYVDSVGKPLLPFLNETNLYQYALSNPIKYTDPMGLKAIYWCFRIYFTPYFQCFTLEDIGPLRIKNLGQVEILNAPCIFNCYFSEEEWNIGRKRGESCEGVL